MSYHARRAFSLLLACGFIILTTDTPADILPDDGFVVVLGGQFALTSDPGRVVKFKGANYHCRLLNNDGGAIDTEMFVAERMNLNCTRDFIHHGSGINPSNLAELVTRIGLAKAHGLKVIVTFEGGGYPSAGSGDEAQNFADMDTVVAALLNEPAVLAWDLRNEPDYGVSSGWNWSHDQPTAAVRIDYLQRAAAHLRSVDGNHLITVGMGMHYDNYLPGGVPHVKDFVDFVCFHYYTWTYWQTVAQAIDELRGYTSKPIMMEEFGYSAFAGSGRTEAQQESYYSQWVGDAENRGIAGIVQWELCDLIDNDLRGDWGSFGILRDGPDYPWKPAAYVYRDNFVVDSFLHTPPPEHAVSGYVRTTGGAGLTGATVRLQPGDLWAVTQPGGYYEIAAVPERTYSFTAGLAAFADERIEEFIVNGPMAQDFALPGSGTLVGWVRRADGAPLAGARILMEPGPHASTSGADGYYMFPGLPQGEYSQRVEVDGVSGVPEDLVYAAEYKRRRVDPYLGIQAPLVNAGFETGNLSGWVSWGQLDGVHESESTFGTVPAHGGEYYMGSCALTDSKSGGVYQRVAVDAGAWYEAAVWIWTRRLPGDVEDVYSRLGVDPTGGTNRYSPAVQWTPQMRSDKMWTKISLIAQAAGAYMTVFVDQHQENNPGWHLSAFDDVSLTQLGTSTSPPGAMAAGWNLMSAPVDSLGHDAEFTLGDLVALGNNLDNNAWAFNPATGYLPYPGGFSEMERPSGYWLWLDTAGENTAMGILSAAETVVPLCDGWTIVGCPFDQAVAFADCSVTDGYDTLALLDAAAEGWVQPIAFYYDPAGAYGFLRADGTGDDDQLRPWRGYWLLAYVGNLSLIVPQP